MSSKLVKRQLSGITAAGNKLDNKSSAPLKPPKKLKKRQSKTSGTQKYTEDNPTKRARIREANLRYFQQTVAPSAATQEALGHVLRSAEASLSKEPNDVL